MHQSSLRHWVAWQDPLRRLQNDRCSDTTLINYFSMGFLKADGYRMAQDPAELICSLSKLVLLPVRDEHLSQDWRLCRRRTTPPPGQLECVDIGAGLGTSFPSRPLMIPFKLSNTRFRRYRRSFADGLFWELAFELLLCRVLSVRWWAVLHLPEVRAPMADRRPNSWVGFASAATAISIRKCSPCGCGTGLMHCNEGMPSLSKDGIGHDRFSENSLLVGLLAL